PLLEAIGPGRVFGDVPEEHLPLRLEAVLRRPVVGNFLPAGEEVDGLRLVGVPHRLRRVDPVLGEALVQAGNGGAVRAVDLEGDEVVAAYADVPAGIDMGDNAAFELEGGVGRVVRIGDVGLALLVDALRDVGGAEAAHRLHLAE